MYKSHLKRILHNPVKIVVIVMILLLPSLEIIQLIDHHSMLFKDLGPCRTIYMLFFLSASSRGHLFQIIYLWLLPLYLLFIIGDDSCNDEKSGYKYVLMSRVGRKKYLKEKWISSFIVSFVIMFISLIINMILVYIFLGKYSSEALLSQDMIGMSGIVEFLSLNYPLLVYFIFVFVASLLSGFVGMLGSIISTTFRDKKYVYAIAFLVWYIFIEMDYSIMYAFQPYTEVPLHVMVGAFLNFVVVCIVSMLGAVWYEKKRACE